MKRFLLILAPHLKRHTLTCVLLVCSPLAAFAAAQVDPQTNAPALPEPGANGVQSRIEVPLNTAAGIHRYRCDATITTKGEAQDVECYGPRTAATDPLLRAITQATKDARYRPGQKDSETIKVFMTMSVLVRVEAKNALVGVFPNDGEH